MTSIRRVGPEDSEAVRRVHLEAFPSAAEADLVDQLDRDGDAVVSLVASDGDEVVGHVLLSRMAIEAEGRTLGGLGLAPVAVLPDHQHRSIGSLLIRSAIEEARAIGTEIVFLLGEPDYYRRFGFSVEAAKPFESPYAGPYFQALLLREEHVPPSRGTARYAPAFAALS